MKTVFSNYIDQLQKKITSDIEKLDQNVKFKKDSWERKLGGGGLTMVIENGNVLSLSYFLPCSFLHCCEYFGFF